MRITNRINNTFLSFTQISTVMKTYQKKNLPAQDKELPAGRPAANAAKPAVPAQFIPVANKNNDQLSANDAGRSYSAFSPVQRAVPVPTDGLASGYEHFNQADIGNIKTIVTSQAAKSDQHTVQRKMSPVQFGGKPGKEKGDGEERKEMYPAISPTELFADIEKIRLMKEPDRCQALLDIYIDSGMDVQENAHEHKDELVTPSDFEGSASGSGNLRGMLRLLPCTTPGNINHNYEQLLDCGGTQAVVVRRLLGDTAGHPVNLDFSAERKSDFKSSRPKLSGTLGHRLRASTADEANAMVATVLTQMVANPCVVPMSAIGGPGHAFTFAYDGTVYYLFQSFVNRHTLLDERYTRKMSAPEVEAYLRAMLTAARGGESGGAPATTDHLATMADSDQKRAVSGAATPGFFGANVGTTCFRYEVHYLDPAFAARALGGERKVS